MAAVQGRVRDGDGVGLGGVAVTNGEVIEATGPDGSFELPLEPGAHAFVWVTVPAGWRVAGDEFYRRLGSLGPGEAVDFDLVSAPERSAATFRVTQIADLHVVVEGDHLTSPAELVDSLARMATEAQPDFAVASGDLTNRGTRAELGSLRGALDTAACPVYPLFAGHDGNEERREAGAAGETLTRNWEAVVGPTYYSFDWGDHHFVLYPTEDGYFSAADQRRKRAWLEADLGRQPAGRQVTVVVHTPPSVEFMEELEQLGVSLILYGHWHSAKAFRHGRVTTASVPPLCFGGIDTSPRSYRVVEYGASAPRLSLRYLGAGSLHSRAPQLEGHEVVWETDVPGGLHRAAAATCPGDALLLSLRDEDLDGRAGVLCLDAATGRERWRAATDASVKNRPVAAGPGRAAVLSVTGQLCSYDVESGQRLWEQRLPDWPERWLFTAPVSADGTVYAGGKAGYGAFDAATGEPRWYTPLEASDNWSCYAGPCAAGDVLVCLVQRRGLVALDLDTGAVTWQQPARVEYQYGQPALNGDTLYSGGEPGELLALSAADGSVLWRVALDAPYAAGLTAAGQALYLSTPDGQVQRRDAADGSLAWAARTGDDLLDLTPYRRGIRSVLAAPMPSGEALVAGANDGVLYLLDLETGTVLDHGAFGMPVTAAITPLEDGFCAGSLDGRLVRYRRL